MNPTISSKPWWTPQLWADSCSILQTFLLKYPKATLEHTSSHWSCKFPKSTSAHDLSNVTSTQCVGATYIDITGLGLPIYFLQKHMWDFKRAKDMQHGNFQPCVWQRKLFSLHWSTDFTEVVAPTYLADSMSTGWRHKSGGQNSCPTQPRPVLHR